MSLHVSAYRFLHRHGPGIAVNLSPCLPVGLEGEELLPAQFVAHHHRIPPLAAGEADEALGMRTLPGKVVADGPHHVALGGVAPHLEPFLHGPVYHIRCGKDVQQLGIGDHAFGKFVIGKLVGTLDDGHHRTVLLAYLLVAEGDCGMYADILASGLHLRRFGILVKNDHPPSGPVGKDLVMNHVEDQGHDQVGEELVLFDLRQLEHDQPPVPEIGHSVGPAYIGIPFTGKELAAYEAEGGQVKIIGVYVLPPANILIMLRHVAVERGKGMGWQAGGVIILDEFCEGYGLLLLVLPEHAAPETLHDTR